MKRTTPTSAKISLRHTTVFVTMLLVLLTSCAVKGSIKTLAGIPIQTEHKTSKNNQTTPFISFEQCAETELLGTQIVQKSGVDAKILLPAFLLAAAFFCLFRYGAASNEHKHPLYSRSKKIHNSVPIFLEYRKLIIHFA